MADDERHTGYGFAECREGEGQVSTPLQILVIRVNLFTGWDEALAMECLARVKEGRFIAPVAIRVRTFTADAGSSRCEGVQREALRIVQESGLIGIRTAPRVTLESESLSGPNEFAHILISLAHETV